MENRTGLVVGALVTHADGMGERAAALAMLDTVSGSQPKTLGADKAYDTADFVIDFRARNVTPHVTSNIARRGDSAIEARTTRHPGYALSQTIRERIEEHVGWGKTVGRIRQAVFRGLKRVDQHFKLTMTASNIVRMARTLMVTAVPQEVGGMSDQSAWKVKRRTGDTIKNRQRYRKTHSTLAQTSWQSPFLLKFQQPAKTPDCRIVGTLLVFFTKTGSERESMSTDQSTAEANGFERLVKERYSCRAFVQRPVETATIERMLNIAQRTPSWCNSQPWTVVITRGAGTDRFRNALFEYASEHKVEPDFAFPREYRGAYFERRRGCGFQLYQSVRIARGDREATARQTMENYRLFGAPHAVIVTTDKALGVYGVLDCGAWVNNFMLAARSLGVASIAQAALGAHPTFVRSYFKLPEDRLVVSVRRSHT